LSCQLQEHPSLLPVDFDISPVTGQLVLSLPSESTLYNSVPEDLDQRVPKLSNSSSAESSSPTSKVYLSCFVLLICVRIFIYLLFYIIKYK